VGLGRHVPNVLDLAEVLWIYPFVVLGYVVAPVREHVRKHRVRVVLAGLAAFVPLFWSEYPVFVPTSEPVERLGFFLRDAGVRGSFVPSLLVPYACAVVAVLVLYALYVGRDGRAIRRQAWLGRKTLGVYAASEVVMWPLVTHGVHSWPQLFALTLAGSLATTALLEKTPWLGPLLLGGRATRTAALPGGSDPLG